MVAPGDYARREHAMMREQNEAMDILAEALGYFYGIDASRSACGRLG